MELNTFVSFLTFFTTILSLPTSKRDTKPPPPKYFAGYCKPADAGQCVISSHISPQNIAHFWVYDSSCHSLGDYPRLDLLAHPEGYSLGNTPLPLPVNAVAKTGDKLVISYNGVPFGQDQNDCWDDEYGYWACQVKWPCNPGH